MNVPAKTQPQTPQTTAGLLKVLTPEIARALPRGMDADRIARLVTTEIRKSRNAKAAGVAKQSLEDCTHESFAGALLTASALGLEPGVNGECYLVPYRDNRRRVVECQLIIGYQGIVKMFWQHPRARGVQVEWVGANDHFIHEDGLNPVLVHKKASGDRGEPVAYWVILKVADADPIVTVLTAAEVKELRRGKVGSSGDIKDPQHWMERKTVLKQALKLAPKTTRLDHAIQVDDRPGTDLARSQAIELPPTVQSTPDYIDGEVMGDPQPDYEPEAVDAETVEPQSETEPDPEPAAPEPAAPAAAGMSAATRRKWENSLNKLFASADCNDLADRVTVIAELTGITIEPTSDNADDLAGFLSDDELRTAVNRLGEESKTGNLGGYVTDLLNTAAQREYERQLAAEADADTLPLDDEQ